MKTRLNKKEELAIAKRNKARLLEKGKGINRTTEEEGNLKEKEEVEAVK